MGKLTPFPTRRQTRSLYPYPNHHTAPSPFFSPQLAFPDSRIPRTAGPIPQPLCSCAESFEGLVTRLVARVALRSVLEARRVQLEVPDGDVGVVLVVQVGVVQEQVTSCLLGVEDIYMIKRQNTANKTH